MVCREFEGVLLQKHMFGRMRRRWIRLYRGTMTVRHKPLTANSPTNLKPKGKRSTNRDFLIHLDSAQVKKGQNLASIKLTLRDGSILRFRVPQEHGPAFRAVWILALEDHILHANRCAGIGPPDNNVESQALKTMAQESRVKVERLQKTLAALQLAIKEIDSKVIDGGITQRLLDVGGASENTVRSITDFYDAVAQENQRREDQLFIERMRAEKCEQSLDIVTKKYNAFLTNQEKRSMVSSEYFTPEGSLRGYADAYHSDDELDASTDNGLAFPKDRILPNVISLRSQLNEEIDRTLQSLQVPKLKRDNRPRFASYGSMTVDGSVYDDCISNGLGSVSSRSDLFQDCISVDSRSFIVNNGFAMVDPAKGSTTTDGTSFKTAYSSVKSDRYTSKQSSNV